MSGNQRPDEPLPLRTDWWWIFDPRLSLRARTVMIIGLGGLLFTALVVWAAGHVFRRNLSEHLGPGLETTAFQLNDKLNRAVRERVRELQLLSGLPIMRTDGSSIEIRRLLESLQAGSREYAWLGYVGRTGTVMMGSQNMAEGTQAEARPWFATARRAGFAVGLDDWPAVTGRLQRQTSDHPSLVTIAVAVPGETGEIAGMVVAVLNWDWARNLQLTVVPNTARGVPLGATVYYNANTVLLDSGVSGWSDPPTAPDLTGLPVRGWLVEESSVGTTYLTGYARSRAVDGFSGTGWVAFARQPLNEVLAPIAGLQRSIAYWALAFLAPLHVAAWVIAGKFSNQLEVIARSAERIREGDTLTEIPRPAGEGELSRMCHSLDGMIVELRTRQRPTNENYPPVDPRFPV